MSVTPELAHYTRVVNDMNAHWVPHPGQVKVGQALFKDNVEYVFVQCGRRWGKSRFGLWVAWRFALLNPNSCIFYFAPWKTQAREIVWANRAIFEYCSPEWIAKVSDQDSRILLKNGSFIKVDGADNPNAPRGITPHMAVVDEVRDVKRDFLEALWPAVAAARAKTLLLGTPCDHPVGMDGSPHHYVEYANEARERMRTTGDAYYIHAPSRDNPHIDPIVFEREKKRLYDRNEGWVWEREWEAKIVIGGKQLIFPMFDRDKHVKPHHDVLAEFEKDKTHCRYFTLCDPGSTSVFAVIFGAIHPYTQKVYILDEIYESSRERTSTRVIWPEIVKKQNELAPDARWFEGYDHAAAWFANEVMAQYRKGIVPVKKPRGEKEDKLGLIKDLLLEDYIMFSDRCTELTREIEQYQTTEAGIIKKENDHGIDCLRYLLTAANYTSIPKQRPVDPVFADIARGVRLEDELHELRRGDDWVADIIDY